MIEEKDYKNTKARNFFGDEIVNKLETQHQDGYPCEYEVVRNTDWVYGCSNDYKVKYNNKNYIVTVTDNVLNDPLYINIITEWKVE